jgi:multiple sugar transport system ATP-binding protein
VTTIYVTHDQVEAMTLGERVAVMRNGELQQVAAPQELYDRPANLFVAGFIGSPSMNFVQGSIESSDGKLSVVFGSERLALDDSERAGHRTLGEWVGKQVITGIRPENLEDAALAANGRPDRQLRGLVRLKEALGSEIVVHFQIEAVPAVSPELSELEEVDESALLDQLDQERRLRRTAFVGRFDVGTRVVEDTQAQIAVAPGALRFFDPGTGQAIP